MRTADYAASNLYERLGVREEAIEAEIRAAYRLALREVHPDLKSEQTGTSRARYDDLMKGVNEARDTLLDPQKRARYNLWLKDRSRAGRDTGDTGSGAGRTAREKQAATADDPAAAPAGSPSDASHDRAHWHAARGSGGARGSRYGGGGEHSTTSARCRSSGEYDPPEGSVGASNSGSARKPRAGERPSFSRTASRKFEAREAEYAAMRAREAEARDRTARAAAGEYGRLSRWLHARPVAVYRAAAWVLGAWSLYAALAFLGVYASEPAAAVCLVGLPLLAAGTYRLWRRRNATAFGLEAGEWVGVAPYNRRWWARTSLEAGYMGPLLGVGVVLVLGEIPPHHPAGPALDLAWLGLGLASLGLAALWGMLGVWTALSTANAGKETGASR